MIPDKKILWNNEMTLAICLVTELDEKEFEENALESHMSLTGESLNDNEYKIESELDIRRLEVV